MQCCGVCGTCVSRDIAPQADVSLELHAFELQQATAEMLRKMVVEKASDLFIKVGSPPSLRIDGAIHFLDTEEVAPQDTQEIFEIIEGSNQIQQLIISKYGHQQHAR